MYAIKIKKGLNCMAMENSLLHRNYIYLIITSNCSYKLTNKLIIQKKNVSLMEIAKRVNQSNGQYH